MGIGSKLQILLSENGMTPIQLSKLINVPEQTIYSLLKRDGSKVSIDVLLLLCSLFNVSAEYFTDREIEVERTPYLALTPAAQRVGRAYDAAPEPIRAIVDTALEPYVDNKKGIPAAKNDVKGEAAG